MLNREGYTQREGVLIGQKVTRFFAGNKYIFKRVRKGEWECIYKEGLIPLSVVQELGD